MVQSQVLDRTFSALSDPTRRRLLEHLSGGPASISELAEPTGLSLPGVLKHVKILEDARLVTTRKQGRTRECRLAPGDLGQAQEWIAAYRERWDERFDRLDALLEREQRSGLGDDQGR